MKLYSMEEERKRMDNITYAENAVKKCTRRVRIHDYIPGQISYNLGGYPAKFSITPTEYDYEVIKALKEKGVGLIQVHEEWNDAIRVLGADKYSSHDPEGMRKFIELCHDFGIKVLPYISSGFIDDRDPDFREEFVRYWESKLYSLHFHYRVCSAKSPEWRTFILGKMKNILDQYDFDGIYNDMGYDEVGAFRRQALEETGVPLRDDSLPYDPYIEDLLSQIYAMIKEKGGISKIHIGWNVRPGTKDKIYDYLWVGESVKEPDSMLMTVPYEPYVVPCPDYKCVTDENYEEFYAQTLPFMQFPLGLDGRPLTADKVNAPGVEYVQDSLTDFYRQVGAWHDAHPNGPFVYSEWSSIPDNVKNRERWAQYLKLYLPMVEENNICHLNVRESTLIKGKMPEQVYMSLFTGVEQYLCMSNLGAQEEKIVFDGFWQDCESGIAAPQTVLQPGRVRFFKKL